MADNDKMEAAQKAGWDPNAGDPPFDHPLPPDDAMIEHDALVEGEEEDETK